MHTNKVHHVTTIIRVAEELGEDDDWLRDVASEMEIEDGVIWVYGVGEDGILAFTDFGIESLIELIKMYIDNQLKASRSAMMIRMWPTPDATTDREGDPATVAKFSVGAVAIVQPIRSYGRCAILSCDGSDEVITKDERLVALYEQLQGGLNKSAAARGWAL